MNVKLADLSALTQAVKTIRKLSPNTGNSTAFRHGMNEMTMDDLLEFCQAIDTASIAVNHVERAMVQIDK